MEWGTPVKLGLGGGCLGRFLSFVKFRFLGALGFSALFPFELSKDGLSDVA